MEEIMSQDVSRQADEIANSLVSIQRELSTLGVSMIIFTVIFCLKSYADLDRSSCNCCEKPKVVEVEATE
jgi:hypothetical protein